MNKAIYDQVTNQFLLYWLVCLLDVVLLIITLVLVDAVFVFAVDDIF